jgi:DNA-binding phage protein
VTPAPIHPDNARQGIAEAAERRAQADMDKADATLDLGRWVRAARDTGIGVTEIAQLAGVSRQAVYDVLRGDGTVAVELRG